ncbi:hypothetical protein CES86_5319 [Brucella lupini]|uniref:Uncharacterized protein n=1 Tax=Brucella lupini TaxID=255457 RepID=A0A256H1Z9_9HYPH|nr:hypothetical protein CES86_5319 [Brucella lupini]
MQEYQLIGSHLRNHTEKRRVRMADPFSIHGPRKEFNIQIGDGIVLWLKTELFYNWVSYGFDGFDPATFRNLANRPVDISLESIL